MMDRPETNVPPPRAFWAGIDEAGYGPNLGPLVMTAIVAEGRPPDLWADLAATVCRAGESADRLWVDDSKLVYQGRQGRPLEGLAGRNDVGNLAERRDGGEVALHVVAGLRVERHVGGQPVGRSSAERAKNAIVGRDLLQCQRMRE